MADQIHVVYSAVTGRIRSIVVPTQAGESIACNLLLGESLALFPMSFAQSDLPTIQAALSQQTGLSPKNDQYAVVDQLGNVIAALCCDPSCGDLAPPNTTLVPNPVGAAPGWTYSAGVFTAPAAGTGTIKGQVSGPA